jgi:hypothetical protein
MTDFYHDDPVDEQVVKRAKPKAIFGSALLLLAGGLFLNTTLAANISLNSGGRVEFGQGMSLTAACAGSTALTATPNSSFINTAGAGAFYFNTITVSGIPASCNGVDFTFSVYDSTTSTALPIFATNKSVARIWNDAGTFKLGSGSVNGASITSNSGAFTVSFTSPVALAANVSRLTLESMSHLDYSCALDLICAPGDIGPGGGTVFYVNLSGFNCGPGHTATGSPTGGLCNYLEAAPATWSGFSADSYGYVANGSTVIPAIQTNTPLSLAQIGLGLKNSNAITAIYGTCTSVYIGGRNFTGSTCPTAPGMARAYRGAGLSDWYLPSAAELNVACQYARSQTINPATVCTNTGNGPTRGGFFPDDYWSSSASISNYFYSLHFPAANFDTNGYNLSFGTKPIRAF